MPGNANIQTSEDVDGDEDETVAEIWSESATGVWAGVRWCFVYGKSLDLGVDCALIVLL